MLEMYDHASPQPCQLAPCFYLKSAQLSYVFFPTNCTPHAFLFSASTSNDYPLSCSLLLLSSNSSSLSLPLLHGFHKYHEVINLLLDANWTVDLSNGKQHVVLVIILFLKKAFGFQATPLLDCPPTSLIIFHNLV